MMNDRWNVTGLILAVVLLATVAFILQRREPRLVGVYMPDAEATHSRWALGQIALGDISNALLQLFHDEPIEFTTHTMGKAGPNTRNRRFYWVLTRDSNSCTLITSRLMPFRVEFADDGIWLCQKGFGLGKFPLVVKLKNIEAPTSVSTVREPADGSRR